MLAYVKDPAEIYRQSFEIIRREAPIARLPDDIASLVVRLIHACGMTDVAESIAFSDDVVTNGRDALKKGAPILCDTAMTAAGIIRRHLPAKNEILVASENPAAADHAGKIGNTRSAAGVDLWGERLDGGVVVIGNAPTALFRLIERIDLDGFRPAAILAFPVGFVGAAESKELLGAGALGIPFITLRGRRGGSAMAAAALNALLIGEGGRVSRWLSIVGLGEGGWAELPALGRGLVESAQFIVGGERHLAMLPASIKAERASWATPLRLTVEEILRHRGRPVAVLATGDPMHFGVGVTLARAVAHEEMLILPGISAFGLAAARLGWSLGDCECLTLHGRPLERLAGFLYPGARLLLLSHDGSTPAKVAGELTRRGCGPSRLIALEHMGGPKEQRIAATAAEWGERQTADLNTLAVECIAVPGTVSLPRLPGLPDDAFTHDGQITKREMRAVTLAALAPLPGQRLWDVGAGCGSIAIEWLRSGRGMRAVAIESHGVRCDIIRANAAALGTPEIEVIGGEAPAALEGLATPDAIFIGGGVAAPGLVERCWAAIGQSGRLVANAVTVQGEATLLRAHDTFGGSLGRIAVSRAEAIGGQLGWRPLMPVTQWTAIKP